MEFSRDAIVSVFKGWQNAVTAELKNLDPKIGFQEDLWERPDPEVENGGGGITRIFMDGAVFEKAGVNFSEVKGVLNPELAKVLLKRSDKVNFYATGTSLVLHPFSPRVPTIHANLRYFEVEDTSWFGGGTDLTPYFLYQEDCRDFHKKLFEVCSRHDADYYPKFKKWCDEYFYLPHRQEGRGVGGLFFDYLGKKGDTRSPEYYWPFVKDLAQNFCEFYFPMVEARKGESWSEKEKEFQLYRRGRYVEFNLLYDRGTAFGLKSNGRVESILMSLPKQASWLYDYQVAGGTNEAELTEILKKPINWIDVD